MSTRGDGGKERPIRAAVYCRVSSAGQEQDGTSLETQAERGRAFAEAHGWTVTMVLREVWSGYSLHERPRLAELREAVRGGLVDIVVCYAVDRLSRRQAHVAILADECERAGARLAFVTEDFEQSAVGEFIRSAKAFAAEVEREKLIERTQRGTRARVAAGKPLVGPRPPYGYRWADAGKTRLIEDPQKAAIVRRLFDGLARGGSTRQLALQLAREGIPTATGKAVWTGQAVSRIVRHPIYTGDAPQFRHQWVKGRNGKKRGILRDASEHVVLTGIAPPLVDRDLAATALARIPLNRTRATRNNKRPAETLLRGGFAKCAHCGSNLIVYWNNGTAYYRCNNRDRHRCPYNAIQTKELDGAVWSRVEAVLTRPEVIGAELERLRRDNPTVDDLAAVDRRAADVARKQRNLIARLADLDDAGVTALVQAELQSLGAQARDLQAERDALQDAREGWRMAQGRLDDLEAWCRNVAANLQEMTYDQKRLALDALSVTAKLWSRDHAPRYEIAAEIVTRSTCACWRRSRRGCTRRGGRGWR